MSFACFRAQQLNAFFTIALRAATEFVPPPPKLGPDDPGPFAFADETRVRRILDAAGFREVKLEPVEGKDGIEMIVGRANNATLPC